MAVYTHLGAEQIAGLIAAYDVGDLVSAKGIAEGISNSNWLVETTRRRFILTLYERRIDTADLPFFLGLLDHLAAKGCAVPRTIHARGGARWLEVDGKAAALIEFMPGVWPTQPTPRQARAVGAAQARVHVAARDFDRVRANRLAPSDNARTLAACGEQALAAIDRELPRTIALAAETARDWPDQLPVSAVHTDLFPDNVLMLGDEVSGIIDFYFACTDAMAYDLAVTHAAWSFDESANYQAEIGRSLIEGYESVRQLEPHERSALPLLARGACLRFVASRAQDWLDTPADALVTRKDPIDFLHRHDFYAEAGARAFA